MKRLIKSSFFIVAVFSVLVFSPACETPEESYSYSFQIIADGDFNGYYILDANHFVEFEGEQVSGAINYSFDSKMETANSIVICATGVTTDTSSISIYIFKDSEIVDSVTAVQEDSIVKVTATIEYKFEDDSAE